MKSVNNNIKLLRKKSGMSQNELAEKIHVTRQTISNYETGKTNPDIEMLMLIAQVFEVDMNYIVAEPINAVASKKKWITLLCWILIWIGIGIIYTKAMGRTKEYANTRFYIAPYMMVKYFLGPIIMVMLGWFLLKALGFVFVIKTKENRILKYVSLLIFLIFGIYFFVTSWYIADIIWTEINQFQMMKVYHQFNSNDVVHFVPGFIAYIFVRICIKIVEYKFLFIFFGIAFGGYKYIRSKTTDTEKYKVAGNESHKI